MVVLKLNSYLVHDHPKPTYPRIDLKKATFDTDFKTWKPSDIEILVGESVTVRILIGN